MLETLQHIDQQILLFLNGFHNPFWDSFMWLFTGKWIWIPMYAAILYVLLKNLNARMAIFTVIAIALTITYADQICATVIRPLVERMRPSNPDNPLSQFIHLVNDKRGGRYGFPSCHAANSFALAFFVMLFFKQWRLTLFIMLWATVNSYSRIYIGVHYPGDLVAGILVGLSGALLIYYSYRYALRQPKITNWVKFDENRKQIEKPLTLQQTNIIIWTGAAITAGISVYSLISVL